MRDGGKESSFRKYVPRPIAEIVGASQLVDQTAITRTPQTPGRGSLRLLRAFSTSVPP